MKVVVAMDSLKGSLSSVEAGAGIKAGITLIKPARTKLDINQGKEFRCGTL